MLSMLTLVTLLTFQQPAGNQAPPTDPKREAAPGALNDPSRELHLSPEEKEAVEALKKVGLEPRHLKFRVGTGIFLMYRSYDRATKKRRSRVLTAKDLAPLAKLTRTKEIMIDSRSSLQAPITDETLAAFQGLVQLERLHLQGNRLTGAGLKYLGGLKKLRFLSLGGNTVTAEGLKTLAGLPQLEFLSVDGVTDAGLKLLATFPALKQLGLGKVAVTDKGLTALEGNEKLSFIGLGDSAIGESGIASLAKIPNLHSLFLTGGRITDKHLALIAQPERFPGLVGLALVGSTVTDEGLKVLHDPAVLPRLRQLQLKGSRVTAQGKERLQKLRPHLKLPNW